MWRQHRRRPVAVGHGAETRDRADPIARQVFAGKDGKHAGDGRRRRSIDCGDARMGMRRPQHEGIALAWWLDIVDIVAVTRNEPPVLDPADRLTDAELLHGT